MTTEGIIATVSLRRHHRPTGRMQHKIFGKGTMPTPVALWIQHVPPDPGYYLLYVGPDGRDMTDTWHQSLEEAMEQAQLEFCVSPTEWTMLKQP